MALEASDIILADDNFATIVEAVKEGRNVFQAIKKSVFYLLSSNLGELLLIAFALFLFSDQKGQLILPLTALQILWINLLTEGLQALALCMGDYGFGASFRPTKKLIAKKEAWQIILIALLTAVSTLWIFQFSLFHGGVAYGRTMAYMTLTFFQLVNALTVYLWNRDKPVAAFFKNRLLVLAIVLSAALQLLLVYCQPLARLFQLTTLNWQDWLLSVGLPLVILGVLCLIKYFCKIWKK